MDSFEEAGAAEEAKQGMLDVIDTLKDVKAIGVPDPEPKPSDPPKADPPAPEPEPEPEPEPKKTEPAKKEEPPVEEPEDDDGIPSDVLEDEEPSEDPPEEEPEIETKGMDEKQAAAFKAQRERIQELEAESKSHVENSKEYKDLQARLKSSEDRLASLDLKNSPKFKKLFDAPIDSVLTEINTMVKAYDGSPDIARKAMQMPLKERKRFLMQEIPEAASELSLLINRLGPLVAKKRDALKDHVSISKQLEQAEIEQAEQLAGESFDSALSNLRSDKNFLLKESKSESWMKGVQKRIDTARESLKKTDPESLATMALRAAQSDDYRILYAKEHKLRLEAEERLGKRRKASPSLGAGAGSKPSRGKDAPGSPKTAAEVAEIVTGRLIK